MPRFLPPTRARPRSNQPPDAADAGRQPLLEFPAPAGREAHAERLFRTQQARSRRPQAQPLGRGAGGTATRTFDRRRGRRGASGPSGWFQRHALGVAYASVVVAVLSVAFAGLQVLHRPDSGASASGGASASEDQTLAASVIPGGSTVAAGSAAAAAGAGGPATSLEVHRTVKVLEPSYTIQAGDTLNRIAARFDTTVERIQAWNDLPDPRALKVGTKLVIPPPLPTSPDQ